MKRTWQATLFGNNTTKAMQYVKNPSNLYERFMNKYFELNQSTGRLRKSLTEDGNELWKKYKGKYLKKYSSFRMAT